MSETVGPGACWTVARLGGCTIREFDVRSVYVHPVTTIHCWNKLKLNDGPTALNTPGVSHKLILLLSAASLTQPRWWFRYFVPEVT